MDAWCVPEDTVGLLNTVDRAKGNSLRHHCPCWGPAIILCSSSAVPGLLPHPLPCHNFLLPGFDLREGAEREEAYFRTLSTEWMRGKPCVDHCRAHVSETKVGSPTTNHGSTKWAPHSRQFLQCRL